MRLGIFVVWRFSIIVSRLISVRLNGTTVQVMSGLDTQYWLPVQRQPISTSSLTNFDGLVQCCTWWTHVYRTEVCFLLLFRNTKSHLAVNRRRCGVGWEDIANLRNVGVSGLRGWDPKDFSISWLETLKVIAGNHEWWSCWRFLSKIKHT